MTDEGEVSDVAGLICLHNLNPLFLEVAQGMNRYLPKPHRMASISFGLTDNSGLASLPEVWQEPRALSRADFQYNEILRQNFDLRPLHLVSERVIS